MESRELFEYGGRKLIGTSGPVSQLGLEGLVIPMMPDLGISMYDPFVGRMMYESQELGEKLFNLADAYESIFRTKYGLIEKEGVPPFQVPPTSAHLIEGHKQKLAKQLIYACAIDARDGQPYFDLEILTETVNNAMTVAEENGISTLGIPSLMSAMFGDIFSMNAVLETTALVARKRLRDASHGQTSIQRVYLSSLPEGHSTVVIPVPVKETVSPFN